MKRKLKSQLAKSGPKIMYCCWSRHVLVAHMYCWCPRHLSWLLTGEETLLLFKLVERHGARWVKIGALMGRFSLTCATRHARQTEKAKDASKTGRAAWSVVEEERMVELVRVHHYAGGSDASGLLTLLSQHSDRTTRRSRIGVSLRGPSLRRRVTYQ